jgi:hypothetical protein
VEEMFSAIRYFDSRSSWERIGVRALRRCLALPLFPGGSRKKQKIKGEKY